MSEENKNIGLDMAASNVGSVNIVGDGAIRDNSPFVSEDDVFEVKVRYYKNGRRVFVEEVDEDFKEFDPNIQTISIVIKYPSQGDTIDINAQSKRYATESSTNNQINAVSDYLQMEVVRFLHLARKWDIEKDLNNGNVLSLNPKIVKGILAKIRNEIGTDGII